MFTDLDDPIPFEPGLDLLERVRRQGRSVRRRRVQRVLGTVGVLLVVAVGAGSLYVARRDAAIDRVNVTTSPSTDGAVNVLLLGVDSIENPVAADMIAVLRFRPDGAVGLLSIPRDLAIPSGSGAHTRISMSITSGMQAMVDAVASATGVPIDHVVELDFDGFRQIVDSLGGIRIGIAAHLRDARLGLDLRPSACATLDGEAALALIRSRWTEVQNADGEWVADPTGDLGRIHRAQLVTTAAVAQLTGMHPSPADLDRISRVLADHAAVDHGLTLGRLAYLGRRLVSAGPVGTRLDLLPVEQFRAETGAAMLRLVGRPAVLADYGAPRGRDEPADGEPALPSTTARITAPQLLPCP